MAKGSRPARNQPSLGLEAEKPKVPEWDPRCYDGGKGPNPYLADWIREHAKPYDPGTDEYRREAFTGIIEATKATAIYNMHTYWSKKPHDAIMQYIEHYTEPGDVVLDPFCGSGSTALSALMLGRKAIAIDLSPAATFITKNYCCPVDPDELMAAFEDVKRRVASEMAWLYETRCHRCGGKATTGYTVYSEVFECVRCGQQVPLYDCPEREGQTAKGKPKTIRVCPHCGEEVSTTRNKRCGSVPVEVSVLCESGCKPVRENRRHDDPDPRKREYFERYDLGKIAEIEAGDIPYWYPACRMMNAPEDQERWGVKWRAGSSNFRTVDELYTRRNLWALAACCAAISDGAGARGHDSLRLVLSSAALPLSRMCRDDWPSVQAGTYYTPPVSRELQVLENLSGRVASKSEGLRAISQSVASGSDACVSTQDATTLDEVPSAVADYVFTDPAYGDTVQYGELNFVWEAWLGLDTHWHDREIVVNDVRGQDEERWYRLMLEAMRECHRVLKPGRWLSLCYHDTSEGTWDLVQQIMDEAGFIPDTAEQTVAIDAVQKSYNQLQADQVLKRDLVINFRKPYPGERPVRVRVAFEASDSSELFEQKVITVIHAFLSRYPGATRDHIWDAVVSRLVRQGDMERHDFDSILRQVAEANEAGEWYLLEEDAEDLADSEAARADAAAEALEARIADHPTESTPGAMEYSDILEWYLYEYRGDRPRRQLLEWLPEYFFQAPGGGYRNPASDEEREQKRMGRESGLNRRVRRYLRDPASVAPAPDQPTLCDWLRHCYRAGLYEEGCKLVDEGHIRLTDLSEELRLDAEEEAAMCRSRLRQRASAPAEKPKSKPKSGKRSVNQRQLDL
jgi:DNA modification methylase